MAVLEKNSLLMGKDSDGNKVMFYPITRLDCVDGADELLSFGESQELTVAQKNQARQNLGLDQLTINVTDDGNGNVTLSFSL